MDILTLLRANIKRKKGTFLGIVFLMIIVSMFLTTIYSVKKNVTKSIDDAYEEFKTANLMMNITNERLSDELLKSVKDHPLVDHVSTMDAVLMRRHFVKDKEDNQSWLIVPMNGIVQKQFSDDFSSYLDEVRPISPEGIYLVQGIATNEGCKVGDDLRFQTKYGEYNFKIEGFVVEPVDGCAMVGWKTVYVAPETFEKLASDVDAVDNPDAAGRVTIVYVYKKADCEMSDGEFARTINRDTGIQDYAYASATKTQMKRYTNLFSDIICSIMIGFAMVLAGVVLIIMAHNITVTIEMSYAELGILKAEGFTKGRIRVLFIMQYLLAEITGAIIGTILSIPMISLFGGIFQPITAIIAKKDVDLETSLTLLLLILGLSVLVILLATRKVAKVSPVKALTGESRDVYFESFLTAPVSGKNLSLSLSYRQFSSNKRRYFVAILITALLMFFMLTVNLMASAMKSKSALEAMGTILCEVEVRPQDRNFTEEEMEAIESVMKEEPTVNKSIFFRNEYVTVNGNTIYCQFYKDPETINMVSGRAPVYDNELVITDILAEDLGLKTGDKLVVARREYREEFIVSGIFCSMNDTGMTMAMGDAGAKKIGVNGYIWYGASLSKPKEADRLAKALEEKLGAGLKIVADSNFSEVSDIKSISTAVMVMRYTIYVFSIIFVLVVVSMICSKSFAQERRDLGIYKAIGFTSRKLRSLFALRFLIIAVIGSAIGTVLSLLFSSKGLSMLLRSVGICNFISNYRTETILIPVILLLGCFFLFAYISARKVKKVEIRELVIE
ncbi:MAG: FtsX-like permease family protein [Clostridiales bacterium]|nr:FtsX-like permease family protein [Clostridiales bacterium]